MSLSHDEIKALFDVIQKQFRPDKAAGLDAIIQFDLVGDDAAQYWVHMKNGELHVASGQADAPNMTVTATAQDFAAMVRGDTGAIQSFMSGRLKVKGDMTLAMKLQSIFGL